MVALSPLSPSEFQAPPTTRTTTSEVLARSTVYEAQESDAILRTMGWNTDLSDWVAPVD
jgi:hypothetical protein